MTRAISQALVALWHRAIVIRPLWPGRLARDDRLRRADAGVVADTDRLVLEVANGPDVLGHARAGIDHPVVHVPGRHVGGMPELVEEDHVARRRRPREAHPRVVADVRVLPGAPVAGGVAHGG